MIIVLPDYTGKKGITHKLTVSQMRDNIIIVSIHITG